MIVFVSLMQKSIGLKFRLISAFIIVLFFAGNTQVKDKESDVDVFKYIDPFICTEDEHGHWHPFAVFSFGMVKPGPDSYPGSLTGNPIIDLKIGIFNLCNYD
jgi:hypothetical protein